MIDEIQKLLDDYLKWLKDKTSLREIDKDWVEITTPHIDRHNDYLQIYVRQFNKDLILLSDDGYIIDDLKLSGCDLNTDKRKELLRITLNGFGVQLGDSDELIIKTRADNFPLQKHNLLQAMLAVNDMFYLSKPMVTSIFLEDVAEWFDKNEIRYTPRIKFTGKTGYDHLFDFVIPKSKSKPERIVQAITRPSRERANNLVFSWIDTREVRPAESTSFAILNDMEQKIPGSVIDALKNYNISPIIWSEREKIKDHLAA